MITDFEQINRAHATSEAAKAFIALGVARAATKDAGDTLRTFDAINPRSPHRELIVKAATGALTTDDLSPLGRLSRAFVGLLSRRTILGRAVGVRRVPPLTRMLPIATGVTAGFVTEGQPIPVDALTWDTETTLTPGKIGIITVHTQELAQSTEGLDVIERDLLRAVALGEDYALLDGAAAVAGGRPASILNGVTPTADSTSATIETDVAAQIADVRGGEAEFPVFVGSANGALWLMRQRSANGERLFPNVNVRGGDIFGIPLLISPAATYRLVLFDAAVLLVADVAAEIQRATQSALQFVTDPALGPQNLVSLWQTNTIGIRTIRYITWAMGVDDGVAYLELPAGSPA